jgi:hypothetical protein
MAELKSSGQDLSDFNTIDASGKAVLPGRDLTRIWSRRLPGGVRLAAQGRQLRMDILARRRHFSTVRHPQRLRKSWFGRV